VFCHEKYVVETARPPTKRDISFGLATHLADVRGFSLVSFMFSYKTSEQTNPVLMRLADQLAKVKL
jgi:hypothetical protein